MNKRLFLLVVVFVTIGGGTFILMKPNPKQEMEKALSHVKRGELSEAEAILAAHPVPIYTPLYRGYIEQARGRIEISDRHLNVAFKEAKRAGNKEMLGEIALLQATNAYFRGSDLEFFARLDTARTLIPEALSLQFFEGLEHYLRGGYAEALRLWNLYSVETNPSWMNSSLDSLFTSSWRKLHAAHCLIEEGNLALGREILEKESRLNSTDPEMLPLATLFLGLSYLQEGQNVLQAERGACYKLARFYFERARTGSLFVREKQIAIAHLEEHAGNLLSTHMSSEERSWGFDFVRILQDWKADPSIERLASRLAQELLQTKGEESSALCAAVRQEFQGTPFHLLLTEKMLSALTQDVKSGDTEDLFSLWALVEQIAPSPKLAAKRIASLTSDEIFETIKKDNSSLARTRAYLDFWERLGRSQSEKEVLACDLLAHSKLFWYHEHQEKKGQRLMEIAINLSSGHPVIEREITQFLTTLYHQAESSNLIERLVLVYDAMERFDINHQELATTSTLANHLADAAYLYKAHNYSAAKTRASWVLRLNPQSEEACRLVGLASFQMGDYGEALVHLQRLTAPDEDTNKALMLSAVFATQGQLKHICQTDPSATYEDSE